MHIAQSSLSQGDKRTDKEYIGLQLTSPNYIFNDYYGRCRGVRRGRVGLTNKPGRLKPKASSLTTKTFFGDRPLRPFLFFENRPQRPLYT